MASRDNTSMTAKSNVTRSQRVSEMTDEDIDDQAAVSTATPKRRDIPYKAGSRGSVKSPAPKAMRGKHNNTRHKARLRTEDEAGSRLVDKRAPPPRLDRVLPGYKSSEANLMHGKVYGAPEGGRPVSTDDRTRTQIISQTEPPGGWQKAESWADFADPYRPRGLRTDNPPIGIEDLVRMMAGSAQPQPLPLPPPVAPPADPNASPILQELMKLLPQ